MFEIRPWSEESEKVFKEISTFGRYRAPSSLGREFSKIPKIRELSNNNLFCISSNRRKRESWFNIPKNVSVSPKFGKKGLVFRFKKLF